MNKVQIFTDGGSRGNPGPAGIGVQVIDSHQKVVFTAAEYIGRATNNEAEYKAFLKSLEWLQEYIKTETVERVEWFLDSKLVVEQIQKNWKIKDARMRKFAQQSWKILEEIKVDYTMTHVRREKNKAADALVNQALDAAVAGAD